MFNINNLSVSEAEIATVEARFGFGFNDAQKNLIRFWESADIQACPGSGKTTTLAGKLILLANKIPANFRQGICVITHTNIAVEEIKAKLGDTAGFYFQYPNHFGTIQSFIDKFLVIPYYRTKFKQSPKIVDEWTYDQEIHNLYELQVNGTLSYLTGRKNVFLGGLSFNRHNFQVSKSVNEKEKWALNGITDSVMEKYYDRIKKAKVKLLKAGYLKYDEAYAFAFRYILKHPKIIDYICERFPVVFVDEMQDMDQEQQEIISKLFEKKSVLQRIGDINQSIFSLKSKEDSKEWVPVTNPNLALGHSNRLSNHLADKVRDICCSPQPMTGWNNPSPVKPVIFVYDDDSILQVKDAFAKKVIENNLHKKGQIKVVGSRINDSKLNINSYWTQFNRLYKRNEHPNLTSFLAEVKQHLYQDKNLKSLRNDFLSCLCVCLRKNKIKNPANGYYFTPFSFVSFLKDAGHLRFQQLINLRIATWILVLRQNGEIIDEVEQSVRLAIKLLGTSANSDTEAFLKEIEVEASSELQENRIYEYTYGNESVALHFDTIHGVKGETHTATLYLETYLRTFDIGGKILNFIMANDLGREKMRKDNACYRKLPHAYVAITRATDFFSLSVNSIRFSVDHKAYFEDENNGWEVVYLLSPGELE